MNRCACPGSATVAPARCPLRVCPVTATTADRVHPPRPGQATKPIRCCRDAAFHPIGLVVCLPKPLGTEQSP